jgi:hypothetical protein
LDELQFTSISKLKSKFIVGPGNKDCGVVVLVVVLVVVVVVVVVVALIKNFN